MSILLAFCLLLVMISMIMALNAMTRLDRIRQQHDMMQKEFTQMRQEYALIQERLLAAAVQAAAPVKTEPELPLQPALPPEENLQEQLRQFQTVVEAYRRQHAGRFPGSLETLATFANRQGLQKTIENPYTHARNPLISEDVCIDITYDPADEGLPEYGGRILFQANFGPRAQVMGYTLAAFDAAGMLLKREDGEVLTMTHQG